MNWMSTPDVSQKLAAFRNQRVINLESYKKNGNPVRTPVVFVEESGKLYFQTALKAWKAKRVMRNPIVRIAPSTFRGDTKGDWINARVVKLEGEEAIKARKVYTRKTRLHYQIFLSVRRNSVGRNRIFLDHPRSFLTT